MDAGEASRTAVLVCQGRAVADGRMAPNRFRDPTAIALLGASESVPVAQVRAADPPSSFGERIEFEMVRVVPRWSCRGRSPSTTLSAPVPTRSW